MKNKDINNYILKIFNTNSSKKKEINDFNNKERAENTIDETSEKWNLLIYLKQKLKVILN